LLQQNFALGFAASYHGGGGWRGNGGRIAVAFGWLVGQKYSHRFSCYSYQATSYPFAESYR